MSIGKSPWPAEKLDEAKIRDPTLCLNVCVQMLDPNARSRDTRWTIAYLVKASILPELLNLWRRGNDALAADGDRVRYGLNMIWRQLQEERTLLLSIRRAVKPDRSDSDIGWEPV
jgi:hypothetical protein